MNVYRFLLKHMYLIRFYFVFIPFWTKKVFENVHTFFWVIIYMKNVYKQALDLVDEQIIAEKGSSMYLYNMFKLIVVCYIFVAFLFFCKAAGDSKAKWNAWNFPFFHFLCQLLSVPLLNERDSKAVECLDICYVIFLSEAIFLYGLPHRFYAINFIKYIHFG